jgi:hypothetical protein
MGTVSLYIDANLCQETNARNAFASRILRTNEPTNERTSPCSACGLRSGSGFGTLGTRNDFCALLQVDYLRIMNAPKSRSFSVVDETTAIMLASIRVCSIRLVTKAAPRCCDDANLCQETNARNAFASRILRTNEPTNERALVALADCARVQDSVP